MALKVAIQGCLHGELDLVYEKLTLLEKKLSQKIDLLIICGDFQSLRDHDDLDDMHCPEKYKNMGTFKDYFENKKVAPFLTIFIGGNHEAVNSLRESYFGGWMARNIYYLGQAGSIFVKKGNTKIRITGFSGIYNHHDFKYVTKTQNYPLKGKDKVISYHLKQLQTYRVELLGRIALMKKQMPAEYGKQDCQFDIMMSHDWPKDIAFYGNTQELYRCKPFLKKQIDTGTFGSPPMLRLLKLMKPAYWFSAHMHIKYPALYPHQNKQFTHFLSLDKCLDKRSCLQLLDFLIKPSTINENLQKQQKVQIELDKTWLTVLNLTKQMQIQQNPLYSYDKMQLKLNDPKKMNDLIKQFPEAYKKVIKNEVQYSMSLLQDAQQLEQTRQMLEKISIQSEMYIGIIFPKRKYVEKVYQQEKQVEDQIQLDL